MKKLKFAALLLAAATTSLTFNACSDDDDDEPTPAPPATTEKSIADIAIENSETDSLVVALQAAGLVTTFQNPGTYTVFAPTNQAFREFLMDGGYSDIADIPVTALDAVLKYHVLGSEVKSGDLTDNTYGVTLNTASPDMDATVVEVDVTGGVKLNNNATVQTANVEASNGVIHIINKVITPKNVVELALSDERFSSLVAALTAYDFGYVDILSDANGTFTIFAPTNDAFDDLLDSNPAWNSLADIDSTTLASVLTYHVINTGNVQSSELSQGQTLSPLNMGTLTVDLTDGAKLQTSNMMQADVKISVTDVQGTNGVIHAVDQVLLP